MIRLEFWAENLNIDPIDHKKAKMQAKINGWVPGNFQFLKLKPANTSIRMEDNIESQIFGEYV
jgi:hypothetical protein